MAVSNQVSDESEITNLTAVDSSEVKPKLDEYDSESSATVGIIKCLTPVKISKKGNILPSLMENKPCLEFRLNLMLMINFIQ